MVYSCTTFREGAFPVGAGARFTDEPEYMISIPDDMDVFTCDIGTFTIWCRDFTQWFTRLEFNTDLFVSKLMAANGVLCLATCSNVSFYVYTFIFPM